MSVNGTACSDLNKQEMIKTRDAVKVKRKEVMMFEQDQGKDS